MDKLNANAGLIILIIGVVLLVVLCVIVWLLIETRKKLAVQRLKFIGQFSADPNTRKMVANITISNRSLSDITITELGLRNGKVNFDYTEAYKKQFRLGKDARVVVGQRDAIRFTLSAEELVKSLVQNTKGKIVLKKICVYAMDTTGIPYIGKVSDVKKLLAELAKNGIDYLPPAFDPANTAPRPNAAAPQPATASQSQPAPMPAAEPAPTPAAEPAPAPKVEPAVPSAPGFTPPAPATPEVKSPEETTPKI